MNTSSSTSCGARRRGTGNTGTGGAETMRRAMNERSHDRANRIRKKRKEEMLFQRRRRRRRDQQVQQPTQQQQPQDLLPMLTSCIESFVNAMMMNCNVVNNQQQFLSAGTVVAALQTLKQSLSSLAASSTAATGASSSSSVITSSDEEVVLVILIPYFQRLLQNNETLARQFVRVLSYCTTTTTTAIAIAVVETSLNLLVDLCQVPSSSNSNSNITGMATTDNNTDYSYYGINTSQQLIVLLWKDVILQEGVNTNVIANAVALLTSSTSSTTTTTKDLAAQLIGNLVSDEVPSSSSNSSPSNSSRDALRLALPYWPQLVSALPITSYACATILKSDETTYGMHFLACLTTSHLCDLLLGAEDSQSAAVYAAWMIESLTKREDAAVELICGDLELLQTLIRKISIQQQQLQPAAAAAAAAAANARESSPSSFFLVPALRAIGNIVTACDGRYVEFFLRNEEFLSTLRNLLLLSPDSFNNNTYYMLDALWLAGCLLCDAGTAGHASTEIGAPMLLPAIVSVLLSSSGNPNTTTGNTFEWKRHAVAAVYNAISEPPPPLAAAATDGPYTATDRIQILERDLWGGKASSDHGERIVKELIQLLTVPDTDTVWHVIEVLNFLLRVIPASRDLFESMDGVDKLEELCTTAAAGTRSEEETDNNMEAISEIAANLLDDLFDDDEDEYGEDVDGGAAGSTNNLAPAVQGGQFTFGVVEAPPAQQQQPAPAFGGGSDGSGGAGRGRGRTVPAWMMKQQQQQTTATADMNI